MHIFIYIYIHVHINLYTSMYVHMYVNTYAYMYMYVYIHIYTCILHMCTYVYIKKVYSVWRSVTSGVSLAGLGFQPRSVRADMGGSPY